MSGQVRGGVLSCGYILDLDGATGVAKAAAEYGFANPGRAARGGYAWTRPAAYREGRPGAVRRRQ